MSVLHRFLVSAALLLAAGTVRADIVVPAGLQPGDPFRLMFVTTFGHDATSDDIAVYDAFAEFSALASGLTQYDSQPVAWHVLGSTFGEAAHSSLSSSQISIYNVADQLLFDAGNPIWGNVFNPTRPLASILTDGGAVYGGLVWTGTNVIGNPFEDYWLGGLGNGGSEVGFDVPTIGWLNFGVDVDATNLHPLYAFSDIITVADIGGAGGDGGGTVTPVPEPDSLALFSSGAALLAFVGARRRRRP
jgi:hypothetical protein